MLSNFRELESRLFMVAPFILRNITFYEIRNYAKLNLLLQNGD